MNDKISVYKDLQQTIIRIPKRYKFINYIYKVNSEILEAYTFFIIDIVLRSEEYDACNQHFSLSETLSEDKYSSIIAVNNLLDSEYIAIKIKLPRQIIKAINKIHNNKVQTYTTQEKIAAVFLFVTYDLLSALQKVYDYEGIICYLEDEYYITKSALNITIDV